MMEDPKHVAEDSKQCESRAESINKHEAGECSLYVDGATDSDK